MARKKHVEITDFGVSIDFNTAGWGNIIVETKDKKLELLCSGDTEDPIKELSRGLVEFTQGLDIAIEISCHEEPGDHVLRLRRRSDNLEISIKHFNWEGDGVPERSFRKAMSSDNKQAWEKMTRRRNGKVKLRGTISFRKAVFMFHKSLQAISGQYGPKAYESSWGYPFPDKEYSEIGQFLKMDHGNY